MTHALKISEMWRCPELAIYRALEQHGRGETERMFRDLWNDWSRDSSALSNQSRAAILAIAPPPDVKVLEFVKVFAYQDSSVNRHNDGWCFGTKLVFEKGGERTRLAPVPDNWDADGQRALLRAGLPDFGQLVYLGCIEAAYRASLPQEDGYWLVSRRVFDNVWNTEVARVDNEQVWFFRASRGEDLISPSVRERCKFLRPVDVTP